MRVAIPGSPGWADQPLIGGSMVATANNSPYVALEKAAIELSQIFRLRIPQTESERCIPSTSVSELRDAGLFRVFQPQRFGGPELPMRSALKIVSEVAKGCPSTAWVLAVLQIDAWMLGLFPDSTQDEVFGDHPDALIAGVLQPRANATKVDKGYELGAGRWPYASGCDHAEWFYLGALVAQANAPPDPMLFLLPAADVAIVDDWHVTGLRGTGSKSLTIDSAFVPSHRSLRLAAAIDGTAGKNRSPLYQSAFVPMLALNVTGPSIGAAKTAIEEFKNHIQQRNLPFSTHKQVAAAQTHQVLAQAMLAVDSAELLVEHAAESIRLAAEQSATLSIAQRARVRALGSAAVSQCVDAVQALFLASGGQAVQQGILMQQLHRDVNAMALHAALCNANNLELWGAAELNQALNSTFV